MGKLFRILATIEFVAIGLVTASRFVYGFLQGDPIVAFAALITGAIAILFALPLYVLGNVVDEVSELREKVFTTATVNPEVHNRQLLASGGWKCSCGRVNADYVSSCACGKSKHDVE